MTTPCVSCAPYSSGLAHCSQCQGMYVCTICALVNSDSRPFCARCGWYQSSFANCQGFDLRDANAKRHGSELHNAIFDNDAEIVAGIIARGDKWRCETRLPPLFCLGEYSGNHSDFRKIATRIGAIRVPADLEIVVLLIDAGYFTRDRTYDAMLLGSLTTMSAKHRLPLMRLMTSHEMVITRQGTRPTEPISKSLFTWAEGLLYDRHVYALVKFMVEDGCLDPMAPVHPWNTLHVREKTRIWNSFGLCDVRVGNVWDVATMTTDQGDLKIADEDRRSLTTGNTIQISSIKEIRTAFTAMRNLLVGVSYYEMARGIDDDGELFNLITQAMAARKKACDEITATVANSTTILRPIAVIISRFVR